MRKAIAPTENITNLMRLYSELNARPISVPERIGLISGASGTGKTTAIAYMLLKVNGVLIEGSPNWTPRWMLHDICKAIGESPENQCKPMEDQIVRQLKISKRPIFVDESNFLVEGRQTKQIINMLGSLYRIHDRSGVAVLMFGLKSFPDYLRRMGNRYEVIDAFDQRVARRLEFQPASQTDAIKLCETLCEVEVVDEVVAELHKGCQGSIRRFLVELSQLEKRALSQGWKQIDQAKYAAMNKSNGGGKTRLEAV
jgi:DNA transposition AAA+ family ATPase